MNILRSETWKKDLDETLQSLPELAELSGKRVLITGAAGLICSAVVDLLIHFNVTHEEKITIIACGRSEEKMRMRFAPYCEEEWFIFTPYDATSLDNSLPACDYIIHGASNATPSAIIREPVETMRSNFLGMDALLHFAKDNQVKRVLFISSSEVYGRNESLEPHKIDEYGFIDLLNPRNSYSISKRAAETICASYWDEYGVDSVIIRPGHIYGPTASRNDNRVSSAWAFDVAKGENILMKSDGAQIRSYCYCLDCASAILVALLKGESVHAYNVSNCNSIISIKGMAEILVESAGVELKMELPSEAERKAFNPMMNSSLDDTQLVELGWKGLFDAEKGFSHTVSILKEIMTEEKT